jgi:hypothetical protein
MSRFLRNGAQILFVVSCIVFVGLLTYQFVMLSGLQRESASGMYQGQLPSTWIVVIGAFSGAISGAAVPFFGACLIERIDRLLAHKEAAE